MREFESTMTTRGQVTIPAAIRAHLRIGPGGRVRCEVVGDRVIVKVAPSRLLDGFGAVQPRKRPEDWRAIREEFERLVAEDASKDG